MANQENPQVLTTLTGDSPFNVVVSGAPVLNNVAAPSSYSQGLDDYLAEAQKKRDDDKKLIENFNNKEGVKSSNATVNNENQDEIMSTLSPTESKSLKTDSIETSTQQNLSAYGASLGDVPPGYKVADCCASCEYYSGSDRGRCYKHDFDCSGNYTCSTYEKEGKILWDDLVQAYSASYNFMNATDEQLQSLSDVIDSDTKLKPNLLEGKLYITDEMTAKLAISFIQYLSDPSLKDKVLKVTSSFAPDSVKLFQSTQILSDDIPSNKVLFKLAQSDREVYEKLFVKKNGTLEGCYIQQLSNTGSETQYVLDGVEVASEVYNTAESRVKNRKGTDYEQPEVDAEVRKILKARTKNV